MRSNHGRNHCSIATSPDGGMTWSDVTFDETLIEPRCQASLIRYTPVNDDWRIVGALLKPCVDEAREHDRPPKPR